MEAVKHYKIIIDVAYDEASIPDDMQTQLHDNVVRCVECGELLNDVRLEGIIDAYSVKVEDL